MKTRIYNLALTILVLIAASTATPALAEDTLRQTQQLKAAFVYNFIKFVEWPDEKNVDSDKPITIGIIGSWDFVQAFEPIKHKKVKGRDISIKYFAGYERLVKSPESDDPIWQQKIAALKTCDVLLLCKCNTAHIGDPAEIIKALGSSSVLTVGETACFLESGGMINFLMEGTKVRFEINNASAKQAKLRIRSQLLRLAQRVISEKPSGKENR
jgi:hypothetical protein